MARRADHVLAPVTLVIGPETLLADRTVQAVVAAARRADAEAEVIEAAAADISAGSFAEQVGPSLFATRRVLVLRDIQDAGDDLSAALRDYAAAPADDVQLVLVHGGGIKAKALVDALRKAGVQQIQAERVTRFDDQVAFVVAEVAAAGSGISDSAARRLVDSVGADLRGLAAAAEQLAADAEGPVTDEVVARYFDGRAEVKGWTIADRAMEGRTSIAVEELQWALDTGTAPVLVVGALAAAVRTLARLGTLGRGLRDADVARELGVPPWKLSSLRRQLHGWTPAGLERALHAVATADLAVKGGSNDARLALTRALVEIGAAREAA